MYVWEMTWPEVCAAGEQRKTVTSLEGYIISSKDRKFNKRMAKDYHATSVARACSRGVDVPLHVRKEYEQQMIATGRISPEEAHKIAFKGLKDTRPKNAKGKLFSWSYTTLSNFEGCPLRYAGEKFYCTVPFVESEALIFGNRVHKSAEQYLKGEKVKEPTLLIPIAQYLKIFNEQKKNGATVQAEVEITLDEEFKPVSWFSKEAWFRAKLDVVVEKSLKVGYYDWKTGGKVRDDQDQLKICCAALSIVKPEIELFTPKLIWTQHKTVTGIKEGSLTKRDAEDVWDDTLHRVDIMRQAWKTETFPARPSGLCPWCGSYDTCPYARRK